MTDIPDAAIEAAAERLYTIKHRRSRTTSQPWSRLPEISKDDQRNVARAAIEAAMPAIREAIAQEVYGIPVIDSEGQRRDGSRMRATAARIVRGAQ